MNFDEFNKYLFWKINFLYFVMIFINYVVNKRKILRYKLLFSFQRLFMLELSIFEILSRFTPNPCSIPLLTHISAYPAASPGWQGLEIKEGRSALA